MHLLDLERKKNKSFFYPPEHSNSQQSWCAPVSLFVFILLFYSFHSFEIQSMTK